VSRRLVVAVAAWVALAASGTAWAAPMYTYKVVLPDGSVFAMVAPLPADQEWFGWGTMGPVEVQAFRRAHPRSGLYRPGAREPAWTVDWYAYDFEVELAPDGRHLVRRNCYAAAGPADKAVSFFANGRVIRTYTVGELVDLAALGPPGEVYWQGGKAELDDDGLTYHVITADGVRHAFDVRTGERSERLVSRRLAAASLAALALAAVLVALWLVRNGRLKKPS